jgi:hypothetical protein
MIAADDRRRDGRLRRRSVQMHIRIAHCYTWPISRLMPIFELFADYRLRAIICGGRRSSAAIRGGHLRSSAADGGRSSAAGRDQRRSPAAAEIMEAVVTVLFEANSPPSSQKNSRIMMGVKQHSVSLHRSLVHSIIMVDSYHTMLRRNFMPKTMKPYCRLDLLERIG